MDGRPASRLELTGPPRLSAGLIVSYPPKRGSGISSCDFFVGREDPKEKKDGSGLAMIPELLSRLSAVVLCTRWSIFTPAQPHRHGRTHFRFALTTSQMRNHRDQIRGRPPSTHFQHAPEPVVAFVAQRKVSYCGSGASHDGSIPGGLYKAAVQVRRDDRTC